MENSEKLIPGIFSSQLGLYLNVEEEKLRFLDSEGNHLLFLDEMADENKKIKKELMATIREKEQIQAEKE